MSERAAAGSQTTSGPTSPSKQPAWLKSLQSDKSSTLSKIGYKGGVFDVAELQWTQTSYIQPQMHPFDRYFYDPDTGNYTVQKYLDDLNARYGGIDSLLMWPTYPQIGVDDRNQFDMFRAMPGGLDAVTRVTAELKAAGVRVLWPYNPWDSGTEREPLSDQDTFATLLKQTGGDGFNGDTMSSIPQTFWTAAEKQDYPIALEPEGGGSDSSLNWATMGWGYWKYPTVPVVARFKYITSGKFMTNICDRWAKSKTNHLQFAWFNGVGFESWENVWGTWNGMVPRDGEALRRVATMLRYFGKAGYLQSPDWVPHSLEVIQADVFASKWPLGQATLWSIVNRAGKNLTGPQLTVASTSSLYYDCYHGVQLTPSSKKQLLFSMEAGGFGCVLQTPSAATGDLAALLSTMRGLTKTALASYSATWSYLLQTMVEIPTTAPAAEAPPGNVLVPKGSFSFKVSGVEIEGNDAEGVDVQYPWESHPQKEHSQSMTLGPFYIDKYPVTTANYSAYLKATGYQPKDAFNWLKNWGGKSTPPSALANVPVTYVSLKEARLYCQWANGGSRLPHSYEWQYAAQGTDGRTYPWGSSTNQKYYPKLNSGNTFPGPEAVTNHAPIGDSPFGVSDLVGNVWQYTDEFQDKHTRSVIVRGGSNYRPSGSRWYFPEALQLNQHNKYLLFDDRFERAGTVGFRCVKDAASEPAAVV